MYTRRVELTTVGELIEELKKLPQESKVYANGTDGYMHIGEDIHDNNCVSFDDSPLEDEYRNARYYAVFGYNTKQWWAYDNKTDEYCDPPLRVLEEIAKHSDNHFEQEEFFNEILSKEPDWLNDEGYRFDEIEY